MRQRQISAFKKGDIIISGVPFVYLLKSNLREKHCDFCLGRPSKVFRCSGCSTIYYCDKECQTKGWKIHRDECPCIKRTFPRSLPDTARTLARIIWKFQRGGDMEEGQVTKTKSRRFKDLISHFKDVRQDSRRAEHFIAVLHVLREFMGPDVILPNETDLLAMYGRVCVNSFNILDTEYQVLGTGVYLGPSVIDHSCSPNAVPVFNGFRLNIVALADIENINKVFISYIDVMNTRVDRRLELKTRYYFDCDCPRCKDPTLDQLMSAIKCGRPSCEGILNLNQEKERIDPCQECGSQYDRKAYDDYLETAEFTRAQLDTMKEINYLDVCRICIKRQGSLFHPLNILRSKILDAAFESSIDMGLWEDAAVFGTELEIAFRKYYGPDHPLLGMLLAKLGKIELHQNTATLAYPHLKEAVTILSVTHSINPDYVRDVRQLLFQAEMLSRNGHS